MAMAIRSAGSGPVFELIGSSVPGGVTWAWALRDLDEANAPAAWTELTGLLTEACGPEWVLTYLGVERVVDLHGLRVLVDVAAELRLQGGQLLVVAPPRCLRVLLARTGLGDALPLAVSARYAVRWVRAQRSPAVRARDEAR